MKNLLKWFGIIALVTVIGFSITACDSLFSGLLGGNNGGGGGGGGSGNTQQTAISVTVGYSSSRTINSSGEHWFKFIGTGDPVIFETRGNTVDTYIAVFTEDQWMTWDTNDNSGEGSNALYEKTTTSGTTYYIKIETRSSTSGAYTFVVTSPTSNIRTNPITVVVGNSSSHIISNSGQHWFKFVGDGNRIFFETSGDVVNSTIYTYIGDDASVYHSQNNGVNFITVLGQTYYIRITGNSGTYTFNVRHGNGDGSSQYKAIEVTNGYSSSHSISYNGEQWFIYQGTGTPVTFKTTGNVVDTYIAVFTEDQWMTWDTDDNSGEGSNALFVKTTTSGTNYFIKIEARSGTSGEYTFVVSD